MITEQLDGKTVEWMEKVSYAQYGTPLRGRAVVADGGARPRPSQAQAAIGDFAPKLAAITDDMLYGEPSGRTFASRAKRRDPGGVDRDHHSPAFYAESGSPLDHRV